jgi:hypothetical protein
LSKFAWIFLAVLGARVFHFAHESRFDSAGIGFQDTAAASIVYGRALQQNRGFEVNVAR